MIRTVRRWWRQPDHYYWITAILAARGLQASASRLVALLVVILGTLPVIMIWSPSGPHGTRDQIVAIVGAACSLVVALYWCRHRWPTRSQSVVFAVLLTASITLTSLTRSSPVSALVTSATFAAVGAYIAFFHTARYLLAMLAIAAATALYSVARLAMDGDIVWAIRLFTAVSVIIVAVSAVTYALVHLLGVEDRESDIEPVTGLLNRNAFYEATGAFIASRSRLDDRYLVIIVINLDNFVLLTDTARIDRARVSVGQALRETTRHDALVAHAADSEFLVADSFVSSDASALVERARSAIRSTPLRMTASIGVVSTPMSDLASCPPYDLLDELVAVATTAMYEARRSGGNRANYVHCARPATLDDYPERFGTEDAC
jgi:diguanylate cyclase (GGDEF)-like protein